MDSSFLPVPSFVKFINLGFNQWKDPDHRVRLAYAQRARNAGKLLHLALNDVHESVRVAAAKNLPNDALRLEVMHSSSCEKCLRVVLRMLDSDQALRQVVAIADLEEELRLSAIKKVKGDCDELLVGLASGQSERLALYAIERMGNIAGLEQIYSEDLSNQRCLAIIDRLNPGKFLEQIFEQSVVHKRRVAALKKISDQDKLKAYYLSEHDPELRTLILERCDDQPTLAEFFADEDEELLREKIVSRIIDQDWLTSVANKDYNMNVRRAAARSLVAPSHLVAVALRNDDQTINEIIFQGDLDDESLLRIARGSGSSFARSEAVARIRDDAILKILYEDATRPDITWFAGRRLGHCPLPWLRLVDVTETLMRVAKEDSQKIIRIAALRQIKEKWALDQLAMSANEEISSIVKALKREHETPTGVRFLPVPARPYELSVFPVTGEEFAMWKREQGYADIAAGYDGLGDFPVTDVTAEEAKQYCDWLGTKDHARYRLPYFHEWQHAALCETPEWFSMSQLRDFANREEAQMVFFGHGSAPRTMHEAISNPWGFLDMIGNVLEWTSDVIYTQEMLTAGVRLDELAQTDLLNSEQLSVDDYAYASGNHWADRRIRSGRWKRLVHRNNLNGNAAKKVGFRVLRIDPQTFQEPVDYELILLPEVALGHTADEVCRALSCALSLSFEDIKKRFTVAPCRLEIVRDYAAIIRIKESWESHGALTKITSTPVATAVRNNA